MRETITENKMGVAPVWSLLLKMALPVILSTAVQALYNIVDGIFVAMISEKALSAITYAMPMVTLLTALSTGIAVGMNTMLSRALGEKIQQEVNDAAEAAVFLGFTRLPSAFMNTQTADLEIFDAGIKYLKVCYIFGIGTIAQLFFERMLISTGKTLYSMISQLVGAVLNIVIDPILIFGLLGAPRLGIVGAAAATVAGQIVAAIMAVIFNIKVNKEIHITFKGFRPSGKRIGNILFIGIPSVIMMAIGSVMTFCMNKILVVFTSTAVAVFGVYFKLQSFAFMPIFGMNSGMVPIIAFNYGAKREDRVIQTLKLAVMYAEIIMILFMIAVQIFPVPMLSIFSASSDMIRMGVPALRTISISFIFAGICIICSSFFQALGSSIYSMLVSFVRQIIFLVPCAYIFSRTGNVNLVWWAWPIAELASVALSVFFFVRVKKKKFGFMEQ